MAAGSTEGGASVGGGSVGGGLVGESSAGGKSVGITGVVPGKLLFVDGPPASGTTGVIMTTWSDGRAVAVGVIVRVTVGVMVGVGVTTKGVGVDWSLSSTAATVPSVYLHTA